MQCPIDQTPLVMSERQGIEVDYCPKCRGVWLDRGELDKIIERSAGDNSNNQAHQSQSEYRQSDERNYNQSYQKPHKKKESFLSDLFDF